MNHPQANPESAKPESANESTPLATPGDVQNTSEQPLETTNPVAVTPPGPSMDDTKEPQELVDWALQHFAGQPVVMTSSYGMEGCVLMDMCSKSIERHGLEPLTVASIDTGFLFPETKQLRKKLMERYPNLNFEIWEPSVSIEKQSKLYGAGLWNYNPNLCCNIRKVQPMSDNIVNYRIWFTALRRSQTKQRADIPVMGWDWRYQLLKFCPLATLTRSDVWKYVQANDVPFNQLHLQGYPSVGCFHCTKAVPGSTPESDAREGRWANVEKEECGLHYQI